MRVAIPNHHGYSVDEDGNLWYYDEKADWLWDLNGEAYTFFGQRKKHYAIEIMLNTFNPNHDHESPYTAYRDGNKRNLNIDNLKWAYNPVNSSYRRVFNNNAGLTDYEVMKIKQALADPHRASYAQMARAFNVSKQTIYNIAKGKAYGNIEGGIKNR